MSGSSGSAIQGINDVNDETYLQASIEQALSLGLQELRESLATNLAKRVVAVISHNGVFGDPSRESSFADNAPRTCSISRSTAGVSDTTGDHEKCNLPRQTPRNQPQVSSLPNGDRTDEHGRHTSDGEFMQPNISQNASQVSAAAPKDNANKVGSLEVYTSAADSEDFEPPGYSKANLNTNPGGSQTEMSSTALEISSDVRNQDALTSPAGPHEGGDAKASDFPSVNAVPQSADESSSGSESSQSSQSRQSIDTEKSIEPRIEPSSETGRGGQKKARFNDKEISKMGEALKSAESFTPTSLGLGLRGFDNRNAMRRPTIKDRAGEAAANLAASLGFMSSQAPSPEKQRSDTVFLQQEENTDAQTNETASSSKYKPGAKAKAVPKSGEQIQAAWGDDSTLHDAHHPVIPSGPTQLVPLTLQADRGSPTSRGHDQADASPVARWSSCDTSASGSYPSSPKSGGWRVVGKARASTVNHLLRMRDPNFQGKEETASARGDFLASIRERVKNVVQSAAFDYSVCAIICLNAVTLGIQTDYLSRHLGGQLPTGLKVLEMIFCFIFSVELLLRLFVHGRRFFHGSGCAWNFFDTIIVGFQILELALNADSSVIGNLTFARLLRILRLVRVIRLVRILRLIRELRMLVHSISNSLKSLGWTVLLLLLLIYTLSLYITNVVTDHRLNDTVLEIVVDDVHMDALVKYFPNLPATMLSFFQAITGGVDWDDLVRPLMEEDLLIPLGMFITYIAFAVLALMNVVTGVFVDSVLVSAKTDKDIFLLNNVREIFKDVAGGIITGGLTWSDFEGKLGSAAMNEFFKGIDVDPSEARSLFVLLDLNESGVVDSDEFFSGCLRLRGPARALDAAIINREVRGLGRRIKSLEQSVLRGNRKDPKLEDKLQEKGIGAAIQRGGRSRTAGPSVAPASVAPALKPFALEHLRPGDDAPKRTLQRSVSASDGEENDKSCGDKNDSVTPWSTRPPSR